MFKDLKTLTLPSSTKALVLVLLIASVTVNAGLFAWSLTQGRTDLLGSTIELFGVLLPVVLVAVVLARSDSGVSALKRRTENFIMRVVPPIVAKLGDPPSGFYTVERRARARRWRSDGRVFANLRRAECDADILVAVPYQPGVWKIVPFHIEVNVGRVNFGLIIPAALIPPTSGNLLDEFEHTIQGARNAGEGHDFNGGSGTGYTFLDHPLRRELFDRPASVLVANKFMSKDFLWESSEQLYLAQDLMFMLRAFLSEKPNLFLSIATPQIPTIADVSSAFQAATSGTGGKG